MFRFHNHFTAVTIASLLAASARVDAATPASGFFLAYSPGIYVEYLSLSDSGRDVSGYLEAIRATPDGEKRVQTFARRSGAGLSFGSYTATRTPNGFTLTSMTQEGQVVQQTFVRTSVGNINASVAALASSVDRMQARASAEAARAEIRNYDALSANDASRLTKAQAAADAAAIVLSAAQTGADRYAAIARQARSEANAAIDKPGVSLAQNQQRIDAMKAADDAEQTLVVAQRSVNTAQTALASAKADVSDLRLRIAESAEHAKALATHLTRNDAIGP